ncbi:MAG: hypothetical protein RJA57_1256 [Bacteroidota bacterium]|jgi:peroxiredoxin Q/BCP
MAVELNEGDKAPSFRARDWQGKPISLSSLRGKKIILYFYPADDTPGCTRQACNLRDHYPVLLKKGYEVIGVSPDPVTRHERFTAKYGLPFRLIPDTEHKLMDRFGVWGWKMLYGRRYQGVIRTTFVIDERGFIRAIFRKPKVGEHAEEILTALD